MNPEVSVILPAYNERENVLPLVKEIHAILSHCNHEIIVVDDNSPDGTAAAVNELKLSGVRALLRSGERGLAVSILDGIKLASGKVIVVMDSDFNHKPSYLPFMISNIQFYPCIVASRFQYGGSMDSRFRHLASWIFNIFTRIATHGSITDSLYGYFAIRADVLKSMPFDQIFWGYGDYCIRLMYYLQKSEVEILQFPAVNGRRLHGTGNSGLIKVLFQYSKEVLKLAWRERFRNEQEDRPLPYLQKR